MLPYNCCPREAAAREACLSMAMIRAAWRSPICALHSGETRSVGLVFQDPMTRLNPLMTVGGHLLDTLRSLLKN